MPSAKAKENAVEAATRINAFLKTKSGDDLFHELDSKEFITEIAQLILPARKPRRKIPVGSTVEFALAGTSSKRVQGTVEGYAHDGRLKVRVMNGLKITSDPPSAPGLPAGRTYNFNEVIYTIPDPLRVKVLYSPKV